MASTVSFFCFRQCNPCDLPSFSTYGWIDPSRNNIQSMKGIHPLKILIDPESVDTCVLPCSCVQVQDQIHGVSSESCPHCWRANPVFCQGPYPKTQLERHVRTAEYQGNRASEAAVLGMQDLIGKLNFTFFCTRPEATAQTSCCHSRYSTTLTLCLTWEFWILAWCGNLPDWSPVWEVVYLVSQMCSLTQKNLKCSYPFFWNNTRRD